MVVVAQLVERWLVEPDVAGSSPVGHPKKNGLIRQAVFHVWEACGVAQTLDASPLVERVESPLLDSPWLTIVWNDPVNLMSYVAWIFRSYFGFSVEDAERRMMLVHSTGRAVVASGPREEMERHVEALHDFGLWATVAKNEA